MTGMSSVAWTRDRMSILLFPPLALAGRKAAQEEPAVVVEELEVPSCLSLLSVNLGKVLESLETRDEPM